MNDFTFIDNELSFLKENFLFRELKTIISASGPWVELENSKRVLQLASNNYLGLANHPEIINACKASISKYGVGSTGSRLLSGTLDLHRQLEKKIAEFEDSRDAIFFSSGYAINVGVISSLINKEDAVYSDELNHASIIDGIRLSGCNKFIYNHNDVNHLEKLILENKNNYKKNFIITDTVFSMNGDISPLKEIAEIIEKHNCISIVDEAHATGIFGKNSSGLIEELNLAEFFPIKIGTCSKAIGMEGGFCVAPCNIISYLQNKSRAFMFSTSPSPGIAGAILKSLELIKSGTWRKEKLWQNAKFLHDGLKKNYKLILNEFLTPIITISFKDIQEAILISNKLFNECNIWAPVIRPPSVKNPIIRLSPITSHSEEDMKYVIKAFEYVSNDIKLDPVTKS